MISAFADSYYFVALLNADDHAHAFVSSFRIPQYGRVVTTHWILMEVADALCDPPQRKNVVSLIQQLLSDPEILVIPSDNRLFEHGLELFAKRKDKSWPLTDCISFVVMREMGIKDALTADRHFEQAGFRALLK